MHCQQPAAVLPTCFSHESLLTFEARQHNSMRSRCSFFAGPELSTCSADAIDTLQQQLANAQREAQHAQAETAATQSELRQRDALIEELQAGSSTGFSCEQANGGQTEELCREAVSAAQACRDNLRAQLLDVRQDAQSISSLQEQLEAAQADAARVPQLQASVAKLQQQCKAAEDAAKAAGDHADCSGAEAQQQIDSLKQQLAAAQQLAHAHEAQAVQLKLQLQQADQAQQQLAQASSQSSQIAQLEAELASAKAELQAQVLRRQSLGPQQDSDVAGLRQQLHESTAKVRDLEVDAALTVQLHKKETINLNNRLVDVQVRPSLQECCMQSPCAS